MWSAGDLGRPAKDHHHNSGSAVEGTSTPPYFGDSMSDLSGTPPRRTESAISTGTAQLDSALAILTAVAQAFPSELYRDPAPLSSWRWW